MRDRFRELVAWYASRQRRDAELFQDDRPEEQPGSRVIDLADRELLAKLEAEQVQHMIKDLEDHAIFKSHLVT